MRRYNLLKYTVVLSLLAFANSCRDNEEKLKESGLTTTLPYVENETDLWLKDNFQVPYNIAALYRWEPQYVDYNRYLIPPNTTSVIPTMEIVKKLWIDTYSTVGGENFVKMYAPKEIIIIGGVNKNKDGTVTLGIAEGGVRISLFQTDNLANDLKNRSLSFDAKKNKIREFIHTIQHEYIHILNQTKPFDEKAFQAIVKYGGLGQYKTDWYQDTDQGAREQGYITAYARASVTEDFAETAAMMLLYSRSEHDNMVNSIQNAKAREIIRSKEKLVMSYYRDAFNMDFSRLVEEADRNSQIVFTSINR